MARRCDRFWNDQSGAVAASYAVALLGLIAIAGVGYDYARMASLDSELQNAADQAALAAATQLDKNDGACSRASIAAVSLVNNLTMMANDGNAAGNRVQVNGGTAPSVSNDACGNLGYIAFFSSYNSSTDFTIATTDETARYVGVRINPREARYALTPVVDAFTSGQLNAQAVASVGSSVCKVPPIMICSPDPTEPFNAAGRAGMGVVATGHSPGNSNNKGGDGGSGTNTTWAPGDFGFLQVQDGDAQSRNARLLQALAFANPPIDCVSVDDNRVNTGNPQGLYDAINTRFGIYDFPSSGNGNVLSSCQSGNCPPSLNSTMDFIPKGSNGNGNANNRCKIGNNGFELPASGQEFKPINKSGWTVNTRLDDNLNVDAMGLPRDLCHYTSFNTSGLCSGGTGRFGNGVWAREDYFTKHHGSDRPSNWQSISRYKTYLWEIENKKIPNSGNPTCGTPAGDANRRVMTVAVVKNCSALSGASTTVDIDEWVDVFLVEPSTDNSLRYNAFKDAIYFEIIGPSRAAGSGQYQTQSVRRDVPYLIE